MTLKDITINLVDNGYVVRISSNEGDYFDYIADDLNKVTTLLHHYIEDPFDKSITVNNVTPIR